MSVPTPDQMLASELFHSYERGWRDAANGVPSRREFTEHKTRPDIASAYRRGHADGDHARATALQGAMAATSYVPTVLR